MSEIATLLPPNAGAVERALEAAAAIRHGDHDEIAVRDLWRPADCPRAALPWLAWALLVRRWDPAWPEELKRRVIARAISDHRIEGTPAAIRRALDDVGAVYELEERPGGAAHTIAITIQNSRTLTSVYAALPAQIRAVKRLSVHERITATEGFEARPPAGAGLGAVAIARFEAPSPVSVKALLAPVVWRNVPFWPSGSGNSVWGYDGNRSIPGAWFRDGVSRDLFRFRIGIQQGVVELALGADRQTPDAELLPEVERDLLIRVAWADPRVGRVVIPGPSAPNSMLADGAEPYIWTPSGYGETVGTPHSALWAAARAIVVHGIRTSGTVMLGVG